MSYTVVIRAFNKDGYHKDLLRMDHRQVWSKDSRIGDTMDSALSGLLGIGGKIIPSDFPEMTHFEVVLVEDK